MGSSESESGAPSTRPELLRWAIEHDLADVLVEDFDCFLEGVELDWPAYKLLERLHENGFCHDLDELLGGQNRALEFRLTSSKNQRLLPDIERAAKEYLEDCLADGPPEDPSLRELEPALRKPTRAALEEESELLALRARPPA